MTKDEFDVALTQSPVKPVFRTHVGDRELFVADGYVPPQHLKYLDRFGMPATPDEYPFGCFATIWYCESRIGLCGIVLCDAFHDPGHSHEAKAYMRIKTAVEMARRDMNRRQKMH
jgi:hypothetical protein